MPLKRVSSLVLIVLTFGALSFGVVARATPSVAVIDDPLVRMPGTQPNPENNVDLKDAAQCLRCHSDYDLDISPGDSWHGSMMAQAGRDFLLWPALTVAAQDAMWAVGSPNATDICERCHFPTGWLEGRSDPTNASAMVADDFDGISCDFCHRLYDPFFEDTHAGIREGSEWLAYWDETNTVIPSSSTQADTTYAEDALQAAQILLFNGDPFFISNQPFSAAYTENGGGQYFVSEKEQRRGPFADIVEEAHDNLYSRYHKSRYFCSTCHDVSNPVLANLSADPANPLPTEVNPAYAYYHVERTWSEFALSAYGQQGGAAGVGPFDPAIFETSYADNSIAKCQDCHMRDVVGQAASHQDAVVRPTESVEHPQSGMPLHDLTGGNAWVSWILASAIPGSPNYDQTNHDLLFQDPLSITLDLSQGLGITPTLLLSSAERAKEQLEMAATIQNVTYDPDTGALSFRIQNQTGHKLLSGYPEGRRMFVNIRAYAGGTLLHEINPYEDVTGTLKSMPGAPLDANETYTDVLVYEMKTSSTLTGEDKTFHFVLADGRYKDNRIPPKGFNIADADERLIEPVWEATVDPAYFTAAEYAGGYDDVSLTIPAGAEALEINLYYQTTSREYIAFLRDEINGTVQTLPAGAYVAQTDPFFDRLRVWGDTIWELWEHNKDVPGAAPYLMDQSTLDIVTITGTGSYSGDQTGVEIDVLDRGPGDCLEEIYIRRTSSHHPEAINDNLRTGVYWSLSQDGCAPGGDFTVTLGLPYVNGTITGDERLCRWTGSTWECGESAAHLYGTTTISRTNVHAFSDWTVGDGVGPNSVTVSSLGMERSSAFVALGLVLITMAAVIVWHKRR